MISYSLSWFKTLYLQVCSPGEQTLLNYTKESHWAKTIQQSDVDSSVPSRNLGQMHRCGT